MKKRKSVEPLKLMPQGEFRTWEFTTGSYCGVAQDSIGIHIGGTGCTLTRQDAVVLRDWLIEAIDSWSPKPRPMKF
jgi:hypothetical protein